MFGAPFWKLAVFPESESWSGAKSEAKLRKSTKYPGGRRVNSRYTRVLRKIPGILPIWPKIWLILGPNQPQTRLRAQNLTISTEFSREKREEKRGCCREKRKGKQTGCERQTVLIPINSRPGSHPVDGRRPLSNTHGAALIRKRIAAVGAPSPPCALRPPTGPPCPHGGHGPQPHPGRRDPPGD